MKRRRLKSVAEYEALAQVYDRLMDHVDYRMWGDYVHELIGRHGNGGRRLLEGGLGTGLLSAHLSRFHYEITGLDRSQAMLKRAKARVSHPLIRGDFSRMPFKGRWDVFLCLYDSLQYVPMENLDVFFQEIARVLSAGGVCVFDLVTERCVKTYWSDFLDREKQGLYDVCRQSWYEPHKQRLQTEFTITHRLSRAVHREKHRQYIYGVEELLPVISRSAFQFVAAYHDFTLDEANSQSDRVHVVIKREAF